MTWTFEQLRAKYPRLTDAQVAEGVELLNATRQSITKAWENEQLMPDLPQAMGPDGLTVAMRELNRFAEENALPLPFVPKAPSE
jgi:hypothetical protein